MTTKKVPKKPDEFRVWVKYQLELRGSSFAIIGRRLRISRQAVQKSVLNPPDRIADELSRDLGLSKKRLWPNRFAA